MTRFSTVSTTENVTGDKFNFPLSTFEISRISLISVSKWLPARLILRRFSPVDSISLRFFCAIAVRPMIAFIGVRISCDMVERKSVFALFAESASIAAFRSFLLNC